MPRLARVFAALLPLLFTVTSTLRASEPDPRDWNAVLEAARSQTVYWHAWGGEPRINDYIAWAGREVERRYGVTVEHVKLSDTAEAVSRVLGEKAAGRHHGGSVDMIWINGENFAAMKRNGLLFGPWVESLPNWRYVDVTDKPTVLSDFTVPTDGLEAPWGMAQIVFFYDTARMTDPPRSMRALLEWARANPGRFAYPQPPDFHGSTFLKQALNELVEDPAILANPAEEAGFDRATAPLWTFIEELKPLLWRGGRVYPQNSAKLRTLLADGEIDIAFSFNPSEASNAIANFELPETVRSFVFEGGTIGNTNFVAIPYNASAKAGAMVLADFLLSPEAQARKQDPEVWGGFTVLDLDALGAEDRARFDALDLGVATLSPDELGPMLPEPHPSWMTRIEETWQARYGAGQ